MRDIRIRRPAEKGTDRCVHGLGVRRRRLSRGGDTEVSPFFLETWPTLSDLWRTFACLVFLFTVPLQALDISKLHPTGYVDDFAHVFDARSAQSLTDYCGAIERLTGVQMAVVTIDSLDGDEIADVSNKLYHQWGIGKKPKDEGLLILFAIKDRKDRAEIGYGLEPVITDADAGAVMRSIRPILRQGSYGPAALAAAQEFADKIGESKGIQIPAPFARPSGPRTYASHRSSIPWPLIVIAIFFILSLVGRGGFGGGGFTGFLTGMFLGNMMGRGGGWGGGGFGGSGGRGGDSGGFGGFGGGDSGGGGASSDW